MQEAGYDEASTRLVQALIDARILLSSGSGEHGTVRLAHQRVLESWTRARKIASASAEFYRARQEVEDQHRRWEASGRKRDLLIPAGLPLAEAENLRKRYAGELSDEVGAYVDASSLRGRARQRRQKIAVAAFALLAVIASAAGVWALRQQQQAEDALRVSRASTSRFLADLARQRLGEDRLGEAVALARRAVPLEIKDWPSVATAENALALAMQTYSSATPRPVVGYVGHEGTVRGAAFSPDGTRLLTWSYDATARLWDVETGTQLRVLQHDDGVRGARFSADGHRALTWAFDGGVRLWNLASGGNAIVLRHDDIVVDAVFSKDETRVLSWSYDGTARLWEAASGRQLAILRHKKVVHDARFFDGDRRILTRSFDGSAGIWRAADGAALATLKHEMDLRGAVLFAHETRVLTWSDDKSARVWNALTGTQLLRFDHELSVEGAALSADESRILTWSNKLVLMSDAVTGKSLARFEHEDAVRGATLSKQGTRLLTWSGRTVQLWDVASDKLLGRTSHSELVLGARFSPDESQVLSWSYDGRAQIWSDPGGKGSRHSQLRHEGVVRTATFSGDGAWVWTRSDDGTVRGWASGTDFVGREAAILRHQAEVLGVASDPNRNRVATVSADGTARLWDMAPTDRFVELHHDEKVLGSAYSRDGARLLSWSADHTARVWDVKTAKQRLVLRHDDVVQGAAFSPDRGPILTWSADGSIRLWDPDKGSELVRFNGPAPVRGAMRSHDRLLAWFEDGSIGLWNATSGAQLAQFTHCGDRVGAAFSADGRYALTWCSDGTLRTLDSERATPIGTMVHDSVSGASFSPDGTRILSWADDGTLRVWDIHRSEPITEMRGSRRVEGAIFFPRGDRVLSWSGENAAKIWDAVTGKQLLALTHAGQVNGALLDGDGTRLWTWSIDGSARLWQATTGNELLRLQHADGVAEAALVASGRMLFTRKVTSGGATVRLWDSRTGDLLASLPDVPHAAVAEDGRHLVTWYDGASVFMWPLWAPTRVLADRASQVTERLRPLSRLARCRAYLDTVGCDRIPATTERELALAGDEKHLRRSVISLSPSTVAPVAKEVRLLAQVKFELVVNERSEGIVFHNQPFRTPLERVEFNTSTRRLAFVLQNGVATEFGINVDPSPARYLESANRVLMVLMNEKTGEPIGGNYYPLLVY
jgi:WD40 repeat protein